jgi:hypothetical protein
MRAILYIGALSVFVAIATAQSRASAKTTAPSQADFTGYWVSQVTEDWRWRMVTPAKGDYASIPLSLEGKRVADTWDPAKDEASGEQCRSYGAPAIMRVPARLRITWQDENTLKVEIDAGQQTRFLRFGAAPPTDGIPSWQGLTVAKWELAPPLPGQDRPQFGAITSITTRMKRGYLRKNGVPYSANALLTEHWDISREPDGSRTLIVTSIVHDPEYLQRDWITALHFKKESDGSKWDPQPCSSRW